MTQTIRVDTTPNGSWDPGTIQACLNRLQAEYWRLINGETRHRIVNIPEQRTDRFTREVQIFTDPPLWPISDELEGLPPVFTIPPRRQFRPALAEVIVRVMGGGVVTCHENGCYVQGIGWNAAIFMDTGKCVMGTRENTFDIRNEDDIQAFKDNI